MEKLVFFKKKGARHIDPQVPLYEGGKNLGESADFGKLLPWDSLHSQIYMQGACDKAFPLTSESCVEKPHAWKYP